MGEPLKDKVFTVSQLYERDNKGEYKGHILFEEPITKVKDIKSAVEWLEDRHMVIKDRVLKILLPKDNKKWNKEDTEYVKAIIDVVSGRWLEQIIKAFPDLQKIKK